MWTALALALVGAALVTTAVSASLKVNDRLANANGAQRSS
jgi:hypothetical protein